MPATPESLQSRWLPTLHFLKFIYERSLSLLNAVICAAETGGDDPPAQSETLGDDDDERVDPVLNSGERQ